MITINHTSETSIYIKIESHSFYIGYDVNAFGDYYVYCSPIGINIFLKETKICYLEECSDWRKESLKLLPYEVRRRLTFLTF